jgi:hypothetical protein
MKKDDKLESVNYQYDLWTKAISPVFSGSVRSEINVIDKRKINKNQIILS